MDGGISPFMQPLTEEPLISGDDLCVMALALGVCCKLSLT